MRTYRDKRIGDRMTENQGMDLMPSSTCSICSCEFDLNGEGGIRGWLGILPVSFCPTCYAGLDDMLRPFDEDECDDFSG